MVGKEIAVRFFDESLEVGESQAGHRIQYTDVSRVGRDNRGLVLIIPRAGGLFVPTHAFVSPEQRDLLFSHLGRTLKRK